MTVNVTNAVGANNTIVLDGSSKIPAFDGSLVTALSATAFTTGTLATARIDVGTTAGKILQLDGSARLPAISGANLVNAPGPTVSTSDPTISTNPTLGAKWINKTSGEVYICTDATAGANVWTNVGAGTGDIALTVEGTLYGYLLGGYTGPNYDTIQKWSFSSDGNSTDVANLTAVKFAMAATPSKTHGYSQGGRSGSPAIDVIDKFVFATDGDSTDVGNLTVARQDCGGFHSNTYGYTAGGEPPASNVIDKFSYSTDGNATDVGDLTTTRYQADGCSDWTNSNGYLCGGTSATNIIERISLSSDGNGVDSTANLLANTEKLGCVESATYGYICGGDPASNVIQKFSFASVADSTDVGNMTNSRENPSGCSSGSHGYNAAGGSSGSYFDTIDKFTTSSDADSTDVGNLIDARNFAEAVHY